MAKEFLSVAEVAAKLGYKPSGVNRLIREGDLPAYKLGNWVVKESELNDWLASKSNQTRKVG